MKRYLIPILVVMSVLSSVALVGCAQEKVIPPKVDTPPQPEGDLLEFRQMKLTQLDQLDTELAALKPKITEAEAEYERLSSILEGAEGKITIKQFTTEEIIASLTIDRAGSNVSLLREQEQKLLAKKQYVERTITEANQYTKLADYYEFKQLQLKEWTTRLLELKLDIEQQYTTVAQQEYNLLLMQRQLLQQDIGQLEQLLGLPKD